MTAKTWKPLDLAKVTAGYLETKGVQNARLDAELLLCQVLGLAKRVDLYAGFENEVPDAALAAYREMVRRRANREPVSRILGVREFMGLSFEVTADVLSPRPETELLVEAVVAFFKPSGLPSADAEPEVEETADPALDKELEKLLDSYSEDADEDEADEDAPQETPQPQGMTLREAARSGAWRKNIAPEKRARPAEAREGGDRNAAALRILDLGTGSGCIAISLAASLPDARVVAVDVSPEALQTARRNARALGVGDRVEFRQGDWFGACRDGEMFDAIVSNPPYLVEGDPDIWPEVSRFDPALALYGGRDGLDCYRAILGAASSRLTADGRVFLEIGHGQAEAVSALFNDARFAAASVAADYAGLERVVSAGLKAVGEK